MVGSHVLGWYFPLTKVSLYLNWACVLSLCICDNIPLECQVSFLWAPQSTDMAPGEDHKSPHCYCYHVNCWLLLSCTHLSKRCVDHFTFIQSQRFPPLFPPASLNYHQWISWNPLRPPLLIVMYKIRCKTAILQSIFLIPWGFSSRQLLSVWLK